MPAPTMIFSQPDPAGGMPPPQGADISDDSPGPGQS
eukprot:SAG22_NODE_10278_length_544_cov_0.496629_1_plen_35_part_10